MINEENIFGLPKFSFLGGTFSDDQDAGGGVQNLLLEDFGQFLLESGTSDVLVLE